MKARALLISTLMLVVALPTAADTIWLKNGRVLQAESARVVGDRVVIERRGVQLALPLSAVERIRRDEERRRPPTVAEGGRDLRGRRDRARLTFPDPEPRVRDATRGGNPFELDPASAEYWRERLAWIRGRIESVEAATRRVPGGSSSWRRAARPAGVDRAAGDETYARLAAFRALERELVDEARRLGVPRVWIDGLGRSLR